MKEKIKETLLQISQIYNSFSDVQIENIVKIIKLIIFTYKKQGKIIIFGNGGSAADSQHIACELVGKFKKDRPPLACIALTTNTSNITAISNDYGYQHVFQRQLEAIAETNDLVIGISTSGTSANVLKAVEYAKQNNLKTVGFTGGDGGKLKSLCDICFISAGKDTPRIQETHISVAHIICELVEKILFS